MSIQDEHIHRKKSKSPLLSSPSQRGPLQAPGKTIPNGLVQRMASPAGTIMPADMLYLQRTIGNRAVSQMLHGGGSPLRVGASDDRFEQEANRVSEQISASGEGRSVQRSATVAQVGPEGGEISGDLASRIRSAKGGGSPAPENIRRAMEEKTGADLSNVRVHNNKEANSISSALGAKAATYGEEIFLGRNQSPHDVQLMAHELTHTIQQTGDSHAQRSPLVQRLGEENMTVTNNDDLGREEEQKSKLGSSLLAGFRQKMEEERKLRIQNARGGNGLLAGIGKRGPLASTLFDKKIKAMEVAHHRERNEVMRLSFNPQVDMREWQEEARRIEVAQEEERVEMMRIRFGIRADKQGGTAKTQLKEEHLGRAKTHLLRELGLGEREMAKKQMQGEILKRLKKQVESHIGPSFKETPMLEKVNPNQIDKPQELSYEELVREKIRQHRAQGPKQEESGKDEFLNLHARIGHKLKAPQPDQQPVSNSEEESISEKDKFIDESNKSSNGKAPSVEENMTVTNNNDLGREEEQKSKVGSSLLAEFRQKMEEERKLRIQNARGGNRLLAGMGKRGPLASRLFDKKIKAMQVAHNRERNEMMRLSFNPQVDMGELHEEMRRMEVAQEEERVEMMRIGFDIRADKQGGTAKT